MKQGSKLDHNLDARTTVINVDLPKSREERKKETKKKIHIDVDDDDDNNGGDDDEDDIINITRGRKRDKNHVPAGRFGKIGALSLSLLSLCCRLSLSARMHHTVRSKEQVYCFLRLLRLLLFF